MPTTNSTFPQKKQFLKLAILLIISLLVTPNIHAQVADMDYARQAIDTLCSPSMHGRGYVQEGDRKAANYLAAEFKRLGLKSFNKGTYFQHFSINVQTFPNKMDVQLNGKQQLAAGADFLIHPTSKGITGNYKVKSISEKCVTNEKKWEKLLKKDYKNKVVLFNFDKNDKALKEKVATFQEKCPATAYLHVEPKKLTWHISPVVNETTELILLQKSLPKKIKSIDLTIDSEYLTDYQTQNVIAYIEGTTQPDSFYVFTAHYDHIGRLGANAYIPGANDNAGGTAMLLNMAAYYQKNPPKYSIAFMAFGAEEVGLVGSLFYVDNAYFPLDKIKFLWNLDLVGTGDEGITLVNARQLERAFQTVASINERENYLVNIKKRGEARNSDHWPFYNKGVPSFFIYARGGIQAYHDIYDRAETLPLTEFNDIMQLMIDFVEEY